MDFVCLECAPPDVRTVTGMLQWNRKVSWDSVVTGWTWPRNALRALVYLHHLSCPHPPPLTLTSSFNDYLNCAPPPSHFQAKPIYGGWLCLAPEGTDFDNPMQRSRVRVCTIGLYVCSVNDHGHTHLTHLTPNCPRYPFWTFGSSLAPTVWWPTNRLTSEPNSSL